MKPTWLPAAIAAGVLLVVGVLAYQHVANRGVAPAVRDSVAVLAASKHPDSMAHAAVVVQAETAFVQSVALIARAHAAEARATASEERARELAQEAARAQSAQDSATLYRQAYEAESITTVGLRMALIDERAATEREHVAALRFKAADSLSQDRLARVERLNATLVGEVDRLSGGCHLLPFLRCPTRKETAIGAAVLTVVVLRQTKVLP